MPKDDAIARGPLVVQLDEPAASDTALVGAKAANLAVAARAGLPVIPGFVVTTAATGQPGGAEPARGDAIHDRWQELSDDGRLPLAVRSSSVAEDSASSSMAGQYLSVLHVTGWDAFAEAVGKVVASAAGVGPVDAPIAVLVQPMARARVGGVMFGLDPLTGSRSRILVSMTDGLPEAIVSGQVTGTSLLLTRRGRLKSVDGTVPPAVHARQRGQLARLARRTARVFGAPQDMEWLIEPDGTLRLLQSRPITAAVPVAHGRVFGPGPVAETFPEPLAHLELDLWVAAVGGRAARGAAAVRGDGPRPPAPPVRHRRRGPGRRRPGGPGRDQAAAAVVDAAGPAAGDTPAARGLAARPAARRLPRDRRRPRRRGRRRPARGPEPRHPHRPPAPP
ncbi:PEP/pyruvate-binding domain-containing protein, partial [Candidatus Frankia alpina]|uniref:PEP/pyruvate-binding domain-containing protein n=1 Tax=Candidatus Frankia alpina TaxID=2699483 RepID=UPI001F3CAB8C